MEKSENELSKEIISSAIGVHRILGRGLIESVYEEAFCYELKLRGIEYKRQKQVPVPYKGIIIHTELRYDVMIENKIIVDLKAKEKLSEIDKPKLLTYLRLTNKKLGLIINFHSMPLYKGINRVVNNLMEIKKAS